MRSHIIQRLVTMKEAEGPLEPLVRRTIEGDPRAWQALWLNLDPKVEAIAGRWRVTGRLSRSWDDRRNIVTRVMGKLRANDFERLGMLHETLGAGEEAGRGWISVVTRREAFNYVREQAEYLGAVPDDGSRWASLVPLSPEVEEKLPQSSRVIPSILAHQIQVYAQENLRPQQLQTLHCWLMGYGTREIADRVGVVDDRTAENLLNRALKNLRYGLADERARPGRRNR